MELFLKIHDLKISNPLVVFLFFILLGWKAILYSIQSADVSSGNAKSLGSNV